MKILFTTWNERIAPVFDVALGGLLVESKDATVVSRTSLKLPGDCAMTKVAFLTEKGIDTLVCGAISRSLQSAVEACGIHVHAFVSGQVPEIIRACLENRLEDPAFKMPGCTQRKRCCNRHGHRQRAKNNLQRDGNHGNHQH